jgi:WD40 repeat protein
LYCGDYTADGRKLIIAGSDRNIYVYDDQKRELKATLHSRDEKIMGHSNRVYSIKCSKKEPNIFVTAGWDGNMKIYDLDQNCPIASVWGPNVSNDSLDICGDMVLAGNNQN